MTRKEAQSEREAFNAFCDGKEIQEKSVTSPWFDTNEPSFNGLFHHRIKPQPKMVQLGPEDVPPGSVIRWNQGRSDRWHIVSGVNDNGVFTTRGQHFSWEELQNEGVEISRDGGKTWQPCEKEETK